MTDQSEIAQKAKWADWTSPDGSVRLLHGDVLERMAELPDDSVDAVVTDPPYGLHFMGKDWDKFGGPLGIDHKTTRERSGSMHAGEYDCRRNSEFQLQMYAWAEAALRVLKPGGHLVAFGGTRTHHRLWCALEDAGFEIRDTLCWLYGSGFPKSLDVSKAIDKAAGAEREVVGRKSIAYSDSDCWGTPNKNIGASSAGSGYGSIKDREAGGSQPITAPATDAARQWQGWGTALKPAWEPIILARKPLSGTVAANVQEHGTGALNVDGCRIEGPPKFAESAPSRQKSYKPASGFVAEARFGGAGLGRWPANVVLDEEAAAMLDAQSGELASGHFPGHQNVGPNYHGGWSNDIAPERWLNSGGASRFFYCAKASRSERGEGNNHPTVKPLALMRWLVRLVTPPGGLILDPFVGSGTTALAAVAEGFRCVGIDNDEEYLKALAKRSTQIVMPLEAVS